MPLSPPLFIGERLLFPVRTSGIGIRQSSYILRVCSAALLSLPVDWRGSGPMRVLRPLLVNQQICVESCLNQEATDDKKRNKGSVTPLPIESTTVVRVLF